MHRIERIVIGLLCLSLQAVLAQAIAKPVTVMIRGSDIDTPEHGETRRLQDALVAVIDFKSGNLIKGETAIYLPEDVRFAGRGFAYKAQLVDSEIKPIRTVEGWCNDTQTLDICARQIFKYLIKQSPLPSLRRRNGN